MRFNYQQRAGRAGRRGQPFAIVLTLCRGREPRRVLLPTSRAHHKRPTASPLYLARPRGNSVSAYGERVSQARVHRRRRPPGWDGPRPPDSHGEFGLVADWTGNTTRMDRVRLWLEESSEVEEVAAHVASASVSVDHLTAYARSDLFVELCEAAMNPETNWRWTCGASCRGGSTANVRNAVSRCETCITGLPPAASGQSIGTWTLAVTEFAPGSQRTKDKRIHQVIGFTAPLVLRQQRWVPASDNPLPARRWMGALLGVPPHAHVFNTGRMSSSVRGAARDSTSTSESSSSRCRAGLPNRSQPRKRCLRRRRSSVNRRQ